MNVTYVYTLTAPSTGCSNIQNVVVTVNPLPIATITPNGATTFCQGGSVGLSTPTGAGYIYQWQKGGVTISSATAATYTATTAGNYTVTVTSASGCSTTSSATTVTVNPLPTATITAASTTSFCEGGSVVLNASTGTGYSYQWKKGGVAISSATAATYTATTSGDYTVTVTASSCPATSAATTVTVNALPTATITAAGPTTFCQGGSVGLSAPAGTGYSYQWQKGGAAIIGATAATYTANTSGNYTVTVTSASGCPTTSSAATTVTVNPLPTATITADGSITFCQGGSVGLSTPTGAGYTYQWKKGGVAINGSPATTATYTANTSGDYTVTVTSASGCSATSAITTITVNPQPTTPTISGPSSFCAGGSVTLTSSTGASYQWSNNGTAISGATAQTYTATTAGNYTVTVNASGCSATSAATTVMVNPLPTATITANGATTFCQGNSVTLTSSTGSSYQWFNNGAAISGATSATYTASTSGDYTVTVTNATNCTATSAATAVKVNPLPTAPTIIASGQGNQTTCSDGTATQTLTATASAPADASVVWYTSSTGSTTTTPTQVGVGTATYYAASVTSVGGCESATRTAVTLTINALPSAAFAYSGSPYCTSGTNPTPTITGATGGTFSSTTGLSLNSSTGAISLSASKAGTYDITYTVSGTCGSTSTASVTITTAPVATFSYASSSYCTSSAAVAATLGTDATVGTFTSTTGLTLDASTGQITPSLSTPGTYTVTNTIPASSGCAATSATAQVIINAIPAIAGQPQPATKTVNQSVAFTATATGTDLSYQWYKGTPGPQTAISGATNATYSIASVTTSDAGDYYVVVSGTCAPAVTSTAATLTVNKADASNSITLAGLGQTYTGSPLATTAMTTVSGTSSFDFTYNQSSTAPTNAGSYAVVATLNNANYSGSATGTLVIGKADQTITWATPSAITYGTALSTDQLNASVTIGDGALTYTPASGVVLGAGMQTLSVTAAATANYQAATKTVSLTVNKADQTIAWATPAAITYGTALSATQLNASVTTGDGTLTYSPVAGTVLGAGAQTLSVTAAATSNYNAATASVSLTVNKADQTIAWTAPAAITYGTPLSATQLNASVTTGDGTLTYTPALGVVLGAGPQTLSVTAAATSDYNAATASVLLTVNKADQTITWATPAAITYGTALSATQLNASVTTGDGVLTYSPVAGTVLGAGPQTLSVTAAETSNYNAATKTVSLTVNKAAQVIAWTTPAAITYGTALSTDQLNASVTTGDGALTYTPASGVVLGAGTQTLSVTAVETSNYKATTVSVSLTVNKADQVITWATPAAITYGTALSATQLNATVAGLIGGSATGALTYTPAWGIVLGAGPQTLSVTAAETSNYKAATASVPLTVNKANQMITWANPADITYGTALSATQLNARATGISGGSAAGALTYSPVAGTVLGAGSQTLSVTAAETSNYNAATKTVSLTVNKADQVITWATPAAITYGTALSATQLNAIVAGVTGGSATGALTYSLATGTVLDAGTYSLKVDAAATENYNAATKTVSLTVNKAAQVIAWTTPAAITYGTALSTDQLNASVTGVSDGSAVGVLTYSPVAGTVLNAGPQTLSVTAAATDNYNAATKTVSLTVNQQSVNPVADTYYTGSSFYWTASSSSNTATLNLVATLKTNANYVGDIRTAKVSFFVRNGTTLTPINGAQNLPVGLVNPGDLSVGTAATNVQYSINGSTTILDIAVVVSGNYKNVNVNDPKTDMPVTVAIPTPGGQIVGGGKFDSNGSAGYIKGSSNFAFYVQYNKSLKNPQGGAEVTVYSNYDRTGNLTNVQHTYQLKSNAISVLSTTNPTAQFSSKANISEIVNGVAQSIEGNCTMQLDMYDGKDNPAVTTDKVDRLAITIYRNNGGIWYSSNWDGTKTVVRDVDAKDVISVTGTGTSTTSAAATTKTVSAISSTAPVAALYDSAVRASAPTSNLLEVFPAPMVSAGTIHFHTTEGGKAQVYVYNAVGALVTTLYNAEVESGQEYYLPLSAENLAEGVYSCRLIVNGKVENKRFSIQH